MEVMEFRHKPLNENISFLYGFKKNGRIYDMVMTVEKEDDTSIIHAWLSKIQMTLKDLLGMWEALREYYKTTYFEFQVIPEHSVFYQKIFKSVEIKKKKTFDGFDSDILTIHRECEFLFKNKF